MQKLLTPLAFIATLLLAGCSIYRMDIQQGNFITQDMIDGLKPGMTKRQVVFLLGTPLITDAFHQNRWDYYYSMRHGRGETSRQRITLVFDNDRLVRLEGDLRPTGDDTSSATTVAESTDAPSPASN